MDQCCRQQSELELHHLSSAADLSPDANLQQHSINSSASVIHSPGKVLRTQPEDLESTILTQDWNATDAEDLLKVHTRGAAPVERDQDSYSNDSDAYAVSNSTQGGIFYQILQTYKNPESTPNDTSTETSGSSLVQRPGSSDRSTPRRKWYKKEAEMGSQDTLATLVGASVQLSNPADKGYDPALKRSSNHQRTNSGNIIAKVWKAKEDQDTKIKFHVAGILKRQQYIIRMCRAMMMFGAPTHRLEESLAQSAKVLEINSQFLYIPGCMIISFDDFLTHTAEVKLVRCDEGVNLAKLQNTHDIYKEVLHDIIGLDEALSRLDDVMKAKNRHPIWLNILMYGLASAAISTFFKARLIDMPLIFGMGTLLGLLQLVVAPLSKTYRTVFEVTATILISFLARAFGSIGGGGIFCFSALAQSGIAMILPGWLVLSSALELQSKAIVPGSIRLVFAILYSLFLGYGITVGTALYGAMDPNATTETTCQNPLNSYWNFLFVPLYVLFACFIVQAKYKQMPVMIAVALTGYVVNFYCNAKFSASAPIAYTFGAFTVGVLANLYSRLGHGVAAAILLPSVYVQVPGGLASSGSIVAALNTATSLIKGPESGMESTLVSIKTISIRGSASKRRCGYPSASTAWWLFGCGPLARSPY
jgi:uncharacterized membrane protein YjjP (DUF1212 family)